MHITQPQTHGKEQLTTSLQPAELQQEGQGRQSLPGRGVRRQPTLRRALPTPPRLLRGAVSEAGFGLPHHRLQQVRDKAAVRVLHVARTGTPTGAFARHRRIHIHLHFGILPIRQEQRELAAGAAVLLHTAANQPAADNQQPVGQDVHRVAIRESHARSAEDRLLHLADARLPEPDTRLPGAALHRGIDHDAQRQGAPAGEEILPADRRKLPEQLQREPVRRDAACLAHLPNADHQAADRQDIQRDTARQADTRNQAPADTDYARHPGDFRHAEFHRPVVFHKILQKGDWRNSAQIPQLNAGINIAAKDDILKITIFYKRFHNKARFYCLTLRCSFKENDNLIFYKLNKHGKLF